MNQWLNENRVSDGSVGDEGENGETVVTRKVGEKYIKHCFITTPINNGINTRANLMRELARIPVRTNHDDRYFSDRYQALPLEGYTSIFEKLLALDNITVRLETDFHRFQEFKPENLSDWK